MQVTATRPMALPSVVSQQQQRAGADENKRRVGDGTKMPWDNNAPFRLDTPPAFTDASVYVGQKSIDFKGPLARLVAKLGDFAPYPTQAPRDDGFSLFRGEQPPEAPKVVNVGRELKPWLFSTTDEAQGEFPVLLDALGKQFKKTSRWFKALMI